MTRKDFRLIAETIRRLNPHKFDRLIIAEDFAGALADNYPNFDTERFIAAATKDKVHA
jgi:hypothetical protein